MLGKRRPKPKPLPVQELVSNALFPVMLAIMHKSLANSGYATRHDLDILIQRSISEVVQSLDVITQEIVASKVATEAQAILHANDDHELPALWVATAHMICVFASRGLYVEKNCMLVASGIVTEQVEDPDKWGGRERVQRLSARLENECRSRGWYTGLLRVV